MHETNKIYLSEQLVSAICDTTVPIHSVNKQSLERPSGGRHIKESIGRVNTDYKRI
jgi:hypothetical protein